MTSRWQWAAIFVCLSVHYVIHHWVSLSGIVNYQEENNIRGLNGTRSCGRPDMAVLYDYTTCWLSPVKCLLTLMNGCNMPRITTRHATHSLMASHNGQDVPAMPQKGSQREREGESEEYSQRCTDKQKIHRVLILNGKTPTSQSHVTA